MEGRGNPPDAVCETLQGRFDEATEKGLRVLLIQEHCLWRDALSRSLASTGWIDVVGPVDGIHDVPSRAIDAILICYGPGQQVVPSARDVRLAFPATPIVVVHAILDGAQAVQAIEGGASAWLDGTADFSQLLDALRIASLGGMYLHPAIGPVMAQRVQGRFPINLTPREKDVMRLILHGFSNPGIADELGVSINSVKSYVKTLYRKLEVSSRATLALRALESGLLSQTDVSMIGRRVMELQSLESEDAR